MHAIVKHGLVGIALAAACAGAAAGPRPLPEVSLTDERGLSVGRERLELGRRWVLMVVDAARPLARPMLDMLEKGEGGWDDAVTVVLIGDDAAVGELDDLQQRLPHVRWYRSTEPRLTERLKVPGVPTILGIDAKGQVAWQMPGLPASAEELQAPLLDWLTVLPEGQ
jgi:hypothetical protein